MEFWNRPSERNETGINNKPGNKEKIYQIELIENINKNLINKYDK